MAKNQPDPSRQSAGGAADAAGNNFQSRAAAWWLGKVLLRLPGCGSPFGLPHASLPIRVAAQTGDPTDDLRVSFSAGEQLYTQCKTDLSVSDDWPAAEGKKNAFASTWIQFYRQTALVREGDPLALVLAVSEASGPIRSLRRVLNRFRHSPAETAFDAPAVAVTKEEQAVARKVLNLFAAFAREPDLTGFANHQDRVLRHTSVQILQVGQSERDWLDLDTLLQLGVLADPGAAPHTLRILSDLGHALHEHRDSLDYAAVRKALTDDGIVLKDAPDLRPEWETLERRSQLVREGVFDTLGSSFHIRRGEDVESLRAALREHRCVVVTGSSGSGKSVVVKDWAQGDGIAASRIIWLSGAELDASSPSQLRQDLGLTVAPDVLFQTETRPSCLVIDGVDRCFSRDGFACLRQWMEAGRFVDPEGAWRLVLTCDETEWERVVRAFQTERVALPPAAMRRINSINTAAIAPLLERFPALANLVVQQDVWELFGNLKILDLVVTRLENGAPMDASGWVSEWQVADWWWQQEVADRAHGASRIAAVLELAKKQGDDSRASIALTELGSQAREAADALRESRAWKLVPASRVDFAHDLFGDWSRQQVLQAEAASGRELRGFLLERATLPLWHRAFRLHAARMLETDEGVAEWQRLFRSVADGSTQGVLVGDILLEGVAFSSRLEVVMAKLWPMLSADGGNLLRRFLSRFLHAASAPDPEVQQRLSNKPKLLPVAAAYHRYPSWGRWIQLLRFLAQHAEFAAAAAPLEIAKMAELWFRWTEKGTPGRTEMGLLAVTAAERLSYEDENDRSWREEPKVARVYGAALRAFTEHPERVRELALQLSGRKERRKKPEEKIEVPPSKRWRRPSWWRRTLRAFKKLFRIPLSAKEESDARIEAYANMGTKYIGPPRESWRKADPWPDGPRFEVSREFQQAFFKTDASEAMMAEDPALAREILLATLIEEPRYVSPHREFGYRDMDENAGLTREGLTEAPFYDEGPFLAFLRMQPEIGLDALITFVNFASERWAEEIREKSKVDLPGAQVRIDGEEREWRGDWRLYYGYRGATWINKPLICALMALERWLHDRLAVGDDIQPTLATLLARSRSVGIGGVLVSFGKRDPQRLLDTLNSLLAVAEFYVWERQQNAQFLDGPSPEWGAPEASYKKRQRWAKLPFRRRDFLDVCQELFATSAEARRQFDAVTAWWKTRSQNLPTQDRMRGALSELIELFDPGKWIPGHDEQGNERWTCSSSDSSASARASNSPADEGDEVGPPDLLYLFDLPEKCSRCLDGQDEAFADDPDALLDVLSHIANTPEQERTLGHTVIVFALIAVLLAKCRDWLRAHPDAERFCRESVLNVTLPVEPPTADQQVLAGNRTPQIFYAAALVVLWAEFPTSRELRLRVANFVAVGMDVGVGALCQHAFGLRAALGKSFLQLQNLIVHAAGERSRHAYSRGLREKPERFAEWFSRASDAFAEGSDREIPVDWSQIKHKQFDLPDTNRIPYSESTDRKHYGLDFEYLVAAFAWTPALDQAQSSDERRHWIETRLRLLEVLRATFPPHQGREDHYEGSPYPAEKKLLSSTARLLLQLQPDDEPARFWKPLFKLGTSAQYWVEEFVKSFLSVPSDDSAVPPCFVTLWNEMLDYASGSPAWKRLPSQGSSDREQLWRCILAIDPLFEGLWEKHVSELTPLWPKIFDLIKTHLRRSDSLPELCRFFKQPFAADFLGDGLLFLEQLCTSDPDEIFDRHDLEDTVARFLLAIRESPSVHGNSTNQSAKAYRTLVALLATRGNSLAIQLQREHGRSPS